MERILRDFPYWTKNLLAWQDGFGIAKLAVAIGGAIAGYILDGPGKTDAAIGAGIVVTLDTITGYMAAVIRKRRRSSYALSRVVSKTAGYMSVVVLAAVMEKVFPGGGAFSLSFGETNIALSPVGGVLWLIIAVEGYSILENVEKMGLGRFKFLRRILGKVIDQAEEDENDDKRNNKPTKE